MQSKTSWRPIASASDGELVLPFHGFVYRDWARDRMVTAVVPVNILWSLGRAFWFCLRFGACRIASDPREAYAQGRRESVRR